MKKLLLVILTATATVTLGGCPSMLSAESLPKEDTPSEYMTYMCYKAIDETKMEYEKAVKNPLKIGNIYPKYLGHLQEVYEECPEDSKYVHSVFDTEEDMDKLYLKYGNKGLR